MQIEFGIPTRRTRTVKEEKYPNTPVVTMCQKPEQRGAYKFEFNQKALELMKFECTGEESVALGFNDSRIFIANVTDGTFDSGYRVAKQGTFSNSKVYEYMEANFELDTSSENVFRIEQAEDVDNAYELVLIDSTSDSAPDEGVDTDLLTEETVATTEVDSSSAVLDLD